jgi:YbbR domain-containing protein
MSKEKNNNLTIKIFALLIAIVFWSYVMNDVNPRITKEYRNINVVYSQTEQLKKSGIVVTSPEEIKVNVKIAGRRNDILAITDKDITAKVDLSGYSAGEKRVSIDVDVPSKVELVDYSPKEVLFDFDNIVNRERPVTVETTGKVASGYILADKEIKPQSVFIKGPKTLVNRVSEVIAYVDVSESTKDLNVTVPIKLVDVDGKEVNGLEKEPNVVDVFIPVKRVKTVPIEIQTEGNIPQGYEMGDIKISPSTVKIMGDEDELAAVKSIKTEVVNISTFLEKESVELKLIIPEGIELAEPSIKPSADIDIHKIIEKTMEYNLDEISVNNLGGGLSIDNNATAPSHIAVTVKGSDKIIEPLTKEDLPLFIDLDGLGEGAHTVPVKVNEINGVEIVNINPSEIQIHLKQ